MLRDILPMTNVCTCMCCAGSNIFTSSSHIGGHIWNLKGCCGQHSTGRIVCEAPKTPVVGVFEDVNSISAPTELTGIPAARHVAIRGHAMHGGVVGGRPAEALLAVWLIKQSEKTGERTTCDGGGKQCGRNAASL